jgi:hypothetical protein
MLSREDVLGGVGVTAVVKMVAGARTSPLSADVRLPWLPGPCAAFGTPCVPSPLRRVPRPLRANPGFSRTSGVAKTLTPSAENAIAMEVVTEAMTANTAAPTATKVNARTNWFMGGVSCTHRLL